MFRVRGLTSHGSTAEAWCALLAVGLPQHAWSGQRSPEAFKSGCVILRNFILRLHMYIYMHIYIEYILQVLIGARIWKSKQPGPTLQNLRIPEKGHPNHYLTAPQGLDNLVALRGFAWFGPCLLQSLRGAWYRARCACGLCD